MANESFLKKIGLSPAIYRSFVGLAGPYHFTPVANRWKEIFDPTDDFYSMKAGHFIDGSEPPMLLIHGEDDGLVGKINMEEMVAASEGKGNRITTQLVPNVGHLTIIGSFSRAFDVHPRIVKDTIAFFRAHGGALQ